MPTIADTETDFASGSEPAHDVLAADLQPGTWRLDLGRNLTLSSIICEIVGVPAERFGNSLDAFIDLVHPEDRPKVRSALARLTGQRIPMELESRIVRPDGGERVVLMTGLALETDGAVFHAGTMSDVTSARAAEVQEAAVAAQMRFASRTARLSGWSLHLASGKVTWIGEPDRALGGAARLPSTLTELIDRFELPFREQVRRSIEGCSRGGGTFDEEVQFTGANEAPVWVRCIGEPVRAESGNVIDVRGFLKNISGKVSDRAGLVHYAKILAELFDSLSGSYFVIDHDWNFSMVNAEFAAALGRDQADLIGKNFWSELPHAVGTALQTKYENAMVSCRADDFVYFSDFLQRWTHVKAVPVAEGLAVHVQDVTEQRLQQNQLRLLETAVSRQNDILLVTEAEPVDGEDRPRIVYVNDAFSRRTGYTREEAIGRSPRFLQGPKTQRDQLDRIRAALEAWEPVRAELINYTKQGKEFWLELDIAPIADSSGHFTHWVAIERDITERKRSEESARLQEERFSVFAKVANDVIWDWDATTDTVWMNAAFETRFGYGPTDSAGNTSHVWETRIYPSDRARVFAGFSAAIRGKGHLWSDEYRFLHADGRIANILDRGTVIRDPEGTVLRVIGNMVDVTEGRASEERLRQSQRLEAIGHLTGGVAHDFNNLLTVILGNAELLIKGLADNEPLLGLAEVTAIAAERGAELTDRLLAVARRQPLEPETVDVTALIASVHRLIRRALPENVEVYIIPGADLWPALVDAGQLEVALLNLAVNSRDAMPAGGRFVIETSNAFLPTELRGTEEGNELGQYVRIRVSDTGTGMTKDVADHAFDPYFTTKDVGKGSGLGLSQLYGFAKQSGGHASVASEVGRGTTLEVYLPRSFGRIGSITPVTVPGRNIGGDETILVVEDDPLVREYASVFLRSIGYQIVSATSGSDALEILSDGRKVDLLFSDVVIPGDINGRQLADLAKALRPTLRVLLTSGYSEEEKPVPANAADRPHLIPKPYRQQDLARMIREMLLPA